MTHSAADRPADVVMVGGTVVTMDPAGGRHEAIAIRDGRIIAVGSSRELRPLAGDDGGVIDLAGATVLPGFIETHIHPAMLGERLTRSVDASSPTNASIADIVERVRDAVAGRGPEDWVIGHGYDDTALRDMRHPTRHDLDEVAPDTPVFLHHVSGHVAVANSRALEMLGISAGTADPDGGEIQRGSDGSPSGVLFETAAWMLHRVMPKPSPDEVARAIGVVGEELARLGITTIHDAAMDPRYLDAYRLAMEHHGFGSRVRGYLVAGQADGCGIDEPDRAPRPGLAGDLQMRGIKMWADGSIQAETGFLSRPYHCSPSHHGSPILTQDELNSAVRKWDERGWQLAIHANGDAAIDSVLQAYAGIERSNSRLPHRIEHFQMGREDQLDEVARMGVLPSVFVKHVWYWGDRHRDIFLGPERATRISPLASLHGKGVPFALHSDAPVTPLSALEGLQVAVMRTTSSGRVLGPEQAVPIETALLGYGRNAARFAGDEDLIGSLEVGKQADLVVLDEDPTRCAPESIAQIGVRATYVAGKPIFERAAGDR
ncbi:amidohydrolase [Enemella sp. A6]|uniref:amidohydrolase n=1 Tax=Enemella sp. A6 TaxID=3440152 RepID=UPI003EBC351B